MMLGSEIPLSEESYPNMNPPERMLQDGGHFNELHSHKPRIISHYSKMQEYSEEEEDPEDEERFQDLSRTYRRKNKEHLWRFVG